MAISRHRRETARLAVHGVKTCSRHIPSHSEDLLGLGRMHHSSLRLVAGYNIIGMIIEFRAGLTARAHERFTQIILLTVRQSLQSLRVKYDMSVSRFAASRGIHADAKT